MRQSRRIRRGRKQQIEEPEEEEAGLGVEAEEEGALEVVGDEVVEGAFRPLRGPGSKTICVRLGAESDKLEIRLASAKSASAVGERLVPRECSDDHSRG